MEQLTSMLVSRSARYGSFVLSSGKVSNLYIDARLTTMSPDGLMLIGQLGLATITTEFGEVDSVGGLTLGADPIAYAIARESATTPHPIRAFSVRKAAKTHGAGRQIEGPFTTGDRVVVIEDVITTGASAIQAVTVLRQSGADVRGVLAIVDRVEGGRAAIEALGLRVVALTEAPDILARLTPS